MLGLLQFEAIWWEQGRISVSIYRQWGPAYKKWWKLATRSTFPATTEMGRVVCRGQGRIMDIRLRRNSAYCFSDRCLRLTDVGP